MHISRLHSKWIPAEIPSQKLIIVLHGRGDSPEGFTWMPEVMGFRDVNYLLLRAPDEYYTGYSWYDLPPNQLPGIMRSRVLLDEVLAEILKQGYETKNIVIFGFSQGCLMTLEWASRVDHSFAACIGISGYAYDHKKIAKDFTASAKQSRWLVTHGTFDDVLDYRTTEGQIRELQNEGLPIEFRAYRKAHTIDDREEMPFLRDYIARAFSLS